MRHGHGMGLLLLATTLLLVTIGVTSTFDSGIMLAIELILLLLLQVIMFIILFRQTKWRVQEVLLFIIGLLVIIFLARVILDTNITNLEVLALIALNLAGFIILSVDSGRKPAPKSQKTLETYDKVHTYDLSLEAKKEPTTRVYKARAPSKKKAKKKAAKKTTKKATKKKTTKKKSTKKSTKKTAK